MTGWDVLKCPRKVGVGCPSRARSLAGSQPECWTLLMAQPVSVSTKLCNKKKSFYDENGVCFFSFYLFQCHTLACQISVHFVLFNTNRLQESYLLVGHLIAFSEREIASCKRFIYLFIYLKKTFSFVFICCHSESASIFGVLG